MTKTTINDDKRCLICGPENPVGLHACFHYDEAAKTITTTATIPDHFQGWQGMAHGGIIAALLDETCAQACIAQGHTVVTVSLTTTYRAPVPTGSTVKVHGSLTNSKGRRLVGQAKLYVGTTLCAEATAVFHSMRT